MDSQKHDTSTKFEFWEKKKKEGDFKVGKQIKLSGKLWENKEINYSGLPIYIYTISSNSYPLVDVQESTCTGSDDE